MAGSLSLRGRRGALLAVFLLLAAGSPAASADGRFGGSLRTFDLYQAPPAGSSADASILSADRLRLGWTGSLGEGLNGEAAAENLLWLSSPPGALPLPGTSINRRTPLQATWGEGEAAADLLSIDRLNLHGSFGGTDVTLGRQAIGFGRIVLLSPLDIIAPFSPTPGTPPPAPTPPASPAPCLAPPHSPHQPPRTACSYR